jgi:hypothetical protein
MSNQSVYRLGGIATFVSLALIIVDAAFTGVVSPADVPLSSRLLNSAAALILVPMLYALYAIHRDQAPTLGRAVWFEYLGAVVLYVTCLLVLNLRPLALYNFAFTAVNMIPSLLFGILIARQPRSGMPRPLGILGVVAGVFGIVRYVLLTLGGGDWTNLNNPALQPFIFFSYIGWIFLSVVWLIWVGVLLLRRRA